MSEGVVVVVVVACDAAVTPAAVSAASAVATQAADPVTGLIGTSSTRFAQTPDYDSRQANSHFLFFLT